MNYALNESAKTKLSMWGAVKKIWPFVQPEKHNLGLGAIAIIINSSLNLIAPLLLGRAIDSAVVGKNYHAVFVSSGILLVIYLGAYLAGFLQTRLMGTVGRETLFNLRNAIFAKLQELPVAFFNQNKAGDLISRINNDTDTLNQFFAQTLMQFIGSVFIMIGAGIFLVWLNPLLGVATLVPAAVLIIFTRAISPWVKQKNSENLTTLGLMSAEVQESIGNFKVILAFNRRDYFKTRFETVNEENYKTAIGAGVANNIFTPVFGLCSNLAQLVILVYGIYLISTGAFTVGLLVSFFAYAVSFYNPLRQIAALWSNFQVALAGWDRIGAILEMENDLPVMVADVAVNGTSVLKFDHVHFAYPTGAAVLQDVNFDLQRGKTYALVGPTGGGKTTTASLMARLFDPIEGVVYLHGRDIRSYTPEERAQKIGFILQEPFLFTGTVQQNILYGNENFVGASEESIAAELKKLSLDHLLERFDEGLETKVSGIGDSMSLGQKQLIAFMRAVLRAPDILILDEATANIDTVTESLLQEVLQALPVATTRVVIAHRLNTIANADEIFFVNGGTITLAGSMEHAVEMLMSGKKTS